MTTPDYQTMIERAHIAIARSPHWCWITNVTLLGKWEVIPDASVEVNVRGKTVSVHFTPISTAATDGFNVYYYAPFLDKAWAAGQDKAIRMLVLHENLHKAFRHMSVWKNLFKLDQKRANCAADIVIGNELMETPDFCLDQGQLGKAMGMKFMHEPACKGMSTGEVWDWLKDNPQAMQGGKGAPGDGIAGDIHMPGGGTGDKEGEGDEHGSGEGELSGEAQEALMDAAVRQGIIFQRGRNPGMADRNAAAMAPKVDWKAALRNWLQGRSFGYDRNDWKKRSRRSHSTGFHLPSHYSERTGKLLVFPDTSGSIGGAELGAFMGEIGSLCNTLQPRECTVGWWDGAMAGIEVYKPGQYGSMVNALKPRGGGGTEIRAPLEFAKKQKNVRGIIVLTDGFVGTWPAESEWGAPVFCVLNSNQSCPWPHVRI